MATKKTDQTALAILDEPRPALEIIQAPAPVTPQTLLEMAVQQGADLDRLEKFMDLADRWNKDQARKAYNEAFARFKAQATSISKNKHVDFTGSTGKRTEYWHATLDNVCDTLIPALAAEGITHRWSTQQESGRITVTCTLTHVGGHSESESLTASSDDSGNKNPIQGIQSTRTYLFRHTLLGVTGTATGETPADDDDGRGAEPPPPQAPADYEQWRADMVAVADEGIQALKDVWERTAPDLRQHASMVDKVWWDALRKTAREKTAAKQT